MGTYGVIFELIMCNSNAIGVIETIIDLQSDQYNTKRLKLTFNWMYFTINFVANYELVIKL